MNFRTNQDKANKNKVQNCAKQFEKNVKITGRHNNLNRNFF